MQFVYLGEFGDTFGPGKHTLTTDNIPVLTKLKSWKYGFKSPFKADVYYVIDAAVHRQQVGHVESRHDARRRLRHRAGARVRHLRLQDRRRRRCSCREVAGSDHNFRLDEFADTMRSRIVSVFTDALATAKVPVLDVAARYTELGEALLPLINPAVSREVRPRDRELHRRERVGAAGGRAGDRQALEHGGGRQPQRLREVPDGQGLRAGRWRRGRGRHGRRAGGRLRHRAADDAAGLRRRRGDADRRARRRPPMPDLLSPADAAKAARRH